MSATGPHAPTHGRSSFSLLGVVKKHARFHSQTKRNALGKPARFRELLRGIRFGDRAFAVVLVLKFFLALEHFDGNAGVSDEKRTVPICRDCPVFTSGMENFHSESRFLDVSRSKLFSVNECGSVPLTPANS